MTARPHNITFDCADPYAQVQFWSQVTGYQEDPENPNEPGDPEGYLAGPDGQPGLLFIPVPEPKTVKNRVHLDLMPTDRTRDEEVERLLGIGATLVADHRRSDGTGWVVLADPRATSSASSAAPPNAPPAADPGRAPAQGMAGRVLTETDPVSVRLRISRRATDSMAMSSASASLRSARMALARSTEERFSSVQESIRVSASRSSVPGRSTSAVSSRCSE